MNDDLPVPGLEVIGDGAPRIAPDQPPAEQVPQDRYSMPPEKEIEWGLADPTGQDRYLLPDPDQATLPSLREEAPWVGFSSSMGPSAVPSAEPEFTLIVRPRERGKDTVAWLVTGGFIVTAAWFLPILLAPTSQLGRVGSFVALALGGIVALAVLWRTWGWANGRE